MTKKSLARKSSFYNGASRVARHGLFGLAMAVFMSCGSAPGSAPGPGPACDDSSTCTASQTCQAGQCVEGKCVDDCLPNQLQCLLGGVSTCVKQPNGCLQLAAPIACPGDQTCSGGACASRCVDQCITGMKRCSGAKVEVCLLQNTGCTDWSAPAGCAEAAACSNNACPGCTDACAAGVSTCGSPTSQQSCQFGKSGCLELTTTTCGAGEMCVDKQCAPPMTCDPTCPTGFSCNFLGQCTGGDITGLVLAEQGFAISGSVTINGAVPNKDAAYCGQAGNARDQVAVVTFTDQTRGYVANVSITCSTPGFTFSTTLPPGTYDVRVAPGSFSGAAKINLLPVNYLIKRGLAVTAATSGLVFNEQGFAVGGSLTVNGAAPNKDATYCNQPSNTQDQLAVVTFTDQTQGYAASVFITCATSGFAFNTTLPAGTYDIRIDRGNFAGGAKVNLLPVSYLAKQGLAVTAAVSGLVLNEQGYAVSGSVTVNGATPNKDTTYCSQPSNTNDQVAIVTFTELTRGYAASVNITCATAGFDFTTTLPAGTYDVRVSQGNFASGAKVNLLPVGYLAKQDLVVSAAVSGLVLNEQGFAVGGSVTINGATPNKDATYCSQSSNTYDQVAIVTFTEPTRGYTASVNITCATAGFAFNTTLPPGTYDARVTLGNFGGAAKVNLLPVSYLAKAGFIVSAAVSGLVLNEQGFAVGGSVTINGAAPNKDATYCSQPSNFNDPLAIVTFNEPTRGYVASVNITCATAGFTFNTLLPPGTYNVRVAQGNFAIAAKVNLLPVNYLVKQGLVIAAAVSGLSLDEQGYAVGGSVTINGAAPNKDSTYCSQPSNFSDTLAVVNFIEPTKGYTASVNIACSAPGFTFKTTLPPGVYEVRVDQGGFASAAKVNLLPINYRAVARLKIP